jgi:hypothetical protein
MSGDPRGDNLSPVDFAESIVGQYDSPCSRSQLIYGASTKICLRMVSAIRAFLGARSSVDGGWTMIISSSAVGC